MDEIAFFTTLLRAYPAMETITLHPLPESSLDEGYLGCQIQCADGTTWVAKAYQRYRPQPDWFRYFYPWATSDAAGWLLTRATTLLYLEQQDYPAPRILRTLAEDLISTTPEWCVLITTFVEGMVLQPTVEQLRLLGATLGTLHNLKTGSAMVAPGKSYWDVDHVFSAIQSHLMSVESELPVEWRKLHTEFSQSLQRLQQHPGLPCSVIHGDVWSANAVQTPTGQAILIDWETGGWGPAIFDLGRLILECHLDSDLSADDPLSWHIHPDARRIAVVIDGYVDQRRLSPLELDILLDALRFGIIFIGALHFTQALQGETHSPEWVNGMQRRFARLQNRWEVSSEIASLARERFS